MSVFCGACSLTITKDGSEVKCSGSCDKVFHGECVKEEVGNKKTRSAWKCKDCRVPASSQSSGKSTSSSTTLTKQFLLDVIEDLKKGFFGELKVVQQDVGEMKTSLEFLSENVDTTNKMMQEMKADLAALKRENQELRVANETLDDEVGQLRDRVRTLEQYTRRNNVEISGVPVTPGEKVVEIVKDVGTALGVPLQDIDIAAAHRIPSFKKDVIPSIVVQFQHRATRDSWVDNFRKKKTMTAREVNPAYPVNRLYVNEHLSPENKLFLARLKKKCREIGFEYAWCRDGKFYARKAQGEKFKKISCVYDIERLK